MGARIIKALEPASQKRPVLVDSREIHCPVTNEPYQLEWSFSFKYFNQIDYFGLDGVQKEWYVSMIERLKDLSKENRELFFKNHYKKEDFRYHEIDWSLKNVPIKRADLNWIDKHYLENEEDFPLWQFHVSKALGRVVGFWNSDITIFFIVLLDPFHNIQPSKKYNYKVTDTNILSCNYSSLLLDIQKAVKSKCQDPNCGVKLSLGTVPTRINHTNILFMELEEEYIVVLDKAISDGKSIKDVLELGLLSI